MEPITVTISLDGDAFCALIGENLQSGISGFGDTISSALRDLADEYNIWQYKQDSK